MWISIVFIGMVLILEGSMIIFGLRMYIFSSASTKTWLTLRRHHQLGANKPVWITEFAATNWNKDAPLPRDHVENFAKESCKYLDTLDWVERYAWFGPMRDTGTVGKWAAMIGDDGQPTALGKAYRDA